MCLRRSHVDNKILEIIPVQSVKSQLDNDIQFTSISIQLILFPQTDQKTMIHVDPSLENAQGQQLRDIDLISLYNDIYF